MNENLNLVEILKDCPKGIKLYSSVFGIVELDHINIRTNYPIVIKLKGTEGYESITSEGKMFVDYDGECVLFPSRENRDWSKFKPTCEFKDGDIVATKNWQLYWYYNWWSSGRHFTWTKSNNMWSVGCFYGTGKELIEKSYEDSELSGKEYERVVKYVESILNDNKH